MAFDNPMARQRYKELMDRCTEVGESILEAFGGMAHSEFMKWCADKARQAVYGDVEMLTAAMRAAMPQAAPQAGNYSARAVRIPVVDVEEEEEGE